MAKMLMEETTPKGATLLEAKSDKPLKPGCLGTMKGPCADFNNPTRNNNFYSRKLWENAFKDPLIKESLEDRVLIGELDHPIDGRLETQAQNACIVMTGYEFDDNNKLLLGTFDILDTPSGRILKSLLEYGCKIGVSSRGEGDVVTKEGVDYVDENSYTFVGFDAVVLPAVKKAKPSLQESVHRKSLAESIAREINNARNTLELNSIKEVINKVNLPGTDSLLESVNIKSKEFEGTTCSTSLLGDLENANAEIVNLQNEIKELKESLTTCRAKVSSLLTSRNELTVNASKAKQNIEDMQKQLNTANAKKDSLKQKLSELTESLDASKQEVEDLQKNLRTTRSMNESLKQKNLSLKEELGSKDKDIESLEESLRESQKVTQMKVGQIKTLTNRVKVLENKNLEQENSHNKLVEGYKAKATTTVNSLRESNKELKGKYSSLLKDYAIVKSQNAGVNASVVLESLTVNSTAQDVDAVIEAVRDRMDRYSHLPITNSSLLENVSGITTNKKANKEHTKTQSFMESAISQM